MASRVRPTSTIPRNPAGLPSIIMRHMRCRRPRPTANCAGTTAEGLPAAGCGQGVPDRGGGADLGADDRGFGELERHGRRPCEHVEEIVVVENHRLGREVTEQADHPM